MHAHRHIRSEVRCDGLRERVHREVSEAARSDEADRDARNARLAYWHGRQRTVDAMYYRHGLCWARSSNNEPPRFLNLPRYRCPSEAALNCER